jgi:hypothetical protein
MLSLEIPSTLDNSNPDPLKLRFRRGLSLMDTELGPFYSGPALFEVSNRQRDVTLRQVVRQRVFNYTSRSPKTLILVDQLVLAVWDHFIFLGPRSCLSAEILL